jgi:hypothetical protein
VHPTPRRPACRPRRLPVRARSGNPCRASRRVAAAWAARGACRPRACVARTGIHARAHPGSLVVPRHFSAPPPPARSSGTGTGRGQWEWGPLDQRVQVQSFSWCMQPSEQHRTRHRRRGKGTQHFHRHVNRLTSGNAEAEANRI